MKRRKNEFLIGIGILFLFLLCYGIYDYFRVFSHYEIIPSSETEQTAGASVLKIDQKIIQYSSDGVNCYKSDNTSIWSETFTMRDPIADFCDNALAVADRNGTTVCVYDMEKGLTGQFETPFSILKIRISRQGVTAISMKEDETIWTYLYKKDGTQIASIQDRIDQNGYPMDFDLSFDGQNLMVSYLNVAAGVAESKLVFYNFGEAGQKVENHLVKEFTYGDELIPAVFYTDNTRATAVKQDGLLFYMGMDSMKEAKIIQTTDEIVSVFQENEKIGYVCQKKDTQGGYEVFIYNKTGKQIFDRRVSIDYTQVKLEDGYVILFNHSEMVIYNLNGKKIFSGTYEKSIENVSKAKGFRRFYVETLETKDTIRLK